MKKRHSFIAFVAVTVQILLLASCEAPAEQPFNTAAEVPTMQTGTFVQVGDLELSWNNEAKCVLLYDKLSDEFWGTTPYEYLMDDGANRMVNSPLYLQYYNPGDGTTNISYAYDGAISEGRVSCESIENGLKITYYFDAIEIAIPVSYTLSDDCLRVTVDPQTIEEHSYKVVAISVAPFFCSTPNGNEDSYLMLPVESGALMYAEQRKEGYSSFSGAVYGADAAQLRTEYWKETPTVRLPVFGVKDGANGLCAIIEEGAHAAYIEAEAGRRQTQYTHAWATFWTRGYDVVEMVINATRSDVTRYSEDLTVNCRYTVAYYPLRGGEADYAGMARLYRGYLDNLYDVEAKTSDAFYLLNILGGAETRQFFLGIPYESLTAATSFAQAGEILNDLHDKTGSSPIVLLKGFGSSGLDIGKLAGGFSFSGELGGIKGYENMKTQCETLGIPLFVDFDLLYFNQGGNGFGTLFDTAKSAMGQRATFYKLTKALHKEDTEAPPYFLLSRKKLTQASECLEDFLTKQGISGVGLSTLGSTAYSDYSDPAYYVKGSMAADAQSIFSKLSNGRELLTSQANDYAAVSADYLAFTPVSNGSYTVLDESIPFYEMVFSGLRPLYGPSINTASNPQKSLLQSIAYGVGPCFSLLYEYDLDLVESGAEGLYASVYAENRDLIVDTVVWCQDYYNAIKGATLTEWRMDTSGYSETRFDNGVIVYTNPTDMVVETPDGPLEPMQFMFTTGGDQQ